jgi:alkylresorcinol/alkylpyrone synthase
MYILSIGTAVPEYQYTQDLIVRALSEKWAPGDGNQKRKIEKIANSTTVATRNLALPIEAYLTGMGFTEQSKKFKTQALLLAVQATQKALNEAGLSPEDVDMIAFTTVTGIAVPTIDALICNAMSFRPDVKRVPLFGLGCVAGAAGTARLHDYLEGHKKGVAILISVELCSLTFQLQDPSPSNIIGSLLFGDGASTLVAIGEDHPLGKMTKAPKTIAVRSRFFKDSEHIMGWDFGSHGFRLVLDPDVAGIVRGHLRDEINRFLSDHKLAIENIKTWVSHPGGPKVLLAIEEALNLSSNELELSWNQLRDYGNLSSSSILFILKKTMESRVHHSGDIGVMLAMGPGFCCEEVLLKW